MEATIGLYMGLFAVSWLLCASGAALAGSQVGCQRLENSLPLRFKAY